MHNGLVVVTFQLVDHPVGAGGLAVVPGAILHCTPSSWHVIQYGAEPA